jgi:hypothetical protein
VAVVCHSVPAERALSIVDRLRRYHPQMRVLRVNPRLHRIDAFYDADSEVLAGPEALLKAIKALLERNARAGFSPFSAGRDEYCGPFAEFPLRNVRAW